MPHSMSPTEVAFVMVALMQGALMLVWLIAAWLAVPMRAATENWAAYAGFSAASFALLTLAVVHIFTALRY